ncbi:MAG: U32 family peptidase [Erysipelotrichaceae bacterium]|nr:U32 family peptidase [Erysipelotrichaceae bacterium]
MSKKVELLAPAGSLDRLRIAYLYGADAVYIGGQDYSMRANAKNFSLSDIKEACTIAHKLGKKVYVTVNIVFHNEDYKDLITYLKKLAEYQVDAIIVSDMSLIDIIHDNQISLPIHISTQMSNANYESVKYLKEEGVERVVLARECSKENIKEIIEKTGIEIECFLHGAMCSSYSGRCVLSNYFTNRDANRGGCAQVCRWCFDLESGTNTIESDTKFTMSCKDLSLIRNLKEMIDIGITSLKVEGRMRSNYYIATVISTYREAIDNYYKGTLDNDKIEYYSKILNRVANRESTSQFFDQFPGVEEQYFLGRQEVSNQDFLGIILDYNKQKKEVTLTQRNYFKKGDIVEVFGPNIKTFSFIIPDIYDEDGNLLEVARHPKQIIKFTLDKEVYPDDIMRIKVI